MADGASVKPGDTVAVRGTVARVWDCGDVEVSFLGAGAHPPTVCLADGNAVEPWPVADRRDERIASLTADFAVAKRQAVILAADVVRLTATSKLQAAVVEAAREALRCGAHDGECTNVVDGEYMDYACDLHVAASQRRDAALADAIADLDRLGAAASPGE